ncbi:MAG: hypothetical protein K6G52_06090 [Treponemataceae bacterium]|nr:hypothetical protein [Treponemataceae bacterium]
MKNKYKVRPFNYDDISTRKEFWINFAVYIGFCVIWIIASLLFGSSFGINNLPIAPATLEYLFYIISICFLVLDLFFLLNLWSIHIRLINACGKKVWHFFLPFYNLYFLFCRPKTEEKAPKKRRWLIPILVFIGLIVIFINLVFTLLVSDDIENVFIAEEREREKAERMEKERLHQEELARRIPDFVIPEMTNENYEFAYNLEGLYYYIKDNSDRVDEYSAFYRDNEIYLMGAPEVIVKNNDVLGFSQIKIGDSVEDVYRIFGDLDYRMNRDFDTVSYDFSKQVDPEFIQYYSVEFFIKDGKVIKIMGFFERDRISGYYDEGE